MNACMKPVALAIAALSAGAAQADVLDLNKLVAERLQKANKLGAIYQKQSGRALPSGVSPSVAFIGEVGGKGLKISIPAMIPERPLVLMTKPVSCSPVDVTYNMGVDQTTTVSTTFSSTDSVETKKEMSATVSYDSPFGASASATVSFSESKGTSITRGGGKETAFKWADSQTFTAPANHAYKVQYVVTERYVDRVPYTANFILAGDTEITFLVGQAGFSWVKVAGTSLPPNVIRPGAQQNGRPLAVCRTYQQNRWRIGKSEGTTCWYGVAELAAFPFGSGTSTGDFEILVGSPQQIQFGDAYAADAFTSTPQGGTEAQKVCFAQHNGWSLPGYIDGRNCVSEWDSRAVVTQSYKVLRTPVSGGVVAKFKLQDYLSEAERTFDLRGVFTDVNQVEGGFRVDSGAACPAAKTTTAAASGNKPSAAAAGSSPALTPKGPPETKTLVLEKAAPNTAVIPATGKIGTAKKPQVLAAGK